MGKTNKVRQDNKTKKNLYKSDSSDVLYFL